MARTEHASHEAHGKAAPKAEAPKEAEVPAATAATPAAAAASTDSRKIVLTLDEAGAKDLNTAPEYKKPDGSAYAIGDTIPRKEYILARWGQKIGRGPISKELTRLQGKAVAYQIVFQATAKVPGGPDPAPAPAAPVTAETPAAAAA